MRTFRKIIFWLHLVAGLTAGLVLAFMAATGATMAFREQILARAERAVARVAMPESNTPRVLLHELLRNFRESHADLRPASVVVSADPAAAIVLNAGRDGMFYADPYTGTIQPDGAPRLRAFFRTVEDCHRWLAFSGDSRNLGKTITGCAAVFFFFLGLSGFYLWWPRSLNWQSVKAIVAFNFKLAGKARDWNWHNVIGFWCLPVMLMSSSTGMVMSFRWANDTLFRLAGSEPPAAEASAGEAGGNNFEIKRPSPDARPLAYEGLLPIVTARYPQWDTITFRLGSPRPRSPGGSTAGGNERVAKTAPEDRPKAESGERGESRQRRAQPVVVSVHEPGHWPRTAAATVTLNPFTGEILREETFASQSSGRQARFWARYLHTGEALGLGGQIVVAVSATGICLMVYTGFALALCRFFGKREKTAV
jgi:uncharacterized iron-regulated membrane protein